MVDQPYQIVIDCWEANHDYDIPILIANGVVGAIVRLNDISGGHHKDAAFDENWAKAKQFPVQTVYFVYNPWKDGQANFDWLISNLPADFGKRRVMTDVEVRYAGYSSVTYASEVNRFLFLVNQYNPAAIYSGGGFLDLLKPWPTNCDYWWAGYSGDLTACTTWAQYKLTLARLGFEAFTRLAPKLPAKMWQCSGDGVRLEGFGGHAIDVNVFPGTLDALREWFGCENGGAMENTWKNDAIGLYTKEATWTNAGFHFIIGHAGEGYSEPNPNLKPIELRAASMNQHFFILWDFNVDYYRKQQYPGDEAHWPPLEMDWPYQYFLRCLTNRTYKGVMIRVMDPYNDGGNTEDPAFIAFAASQFVARVNGWLEKNRPGTPLVLITSNDFISKCAPNMNNWAYKYNSCVEQSAVLPLDASFPQAADKVKAYISIRPTVEFWYYYKGLVLFMGTPEKLGTFLGTGTEPPPPVPDPEPEPTELEGRVTALEGEVEVLRDEVADIWAAIRDFGKNAPAG